jgi:hypothetical protein
MDKYPFALHKKDISLPENRINLLDKKINNKGINSFKTFRITKSIKNIKFHEQNNLPI